MAQYSATPVFFGGISSVVSARVSSSPQVGDKITYDGIDYVYIYNAGTTQISKGNLCVPATATAGYSCTVSSAVYGIPVGVCVHATLTTNTYGWVATKGTMQVVAGSACAQGTAICVGSNGAFATYVCGTTGKEYGYTTSASSGSTGMVTAYISF